ncbi:DUF998 domain-containing protein [Actinomycetospora atypica]|uniref:DUF998 domain-containing protein n=1 Tax=Actinomycetospora atypica TaxID=1290095 RepID=A0ABV9YP82_9PSEU
MARRAPGTDTRPGPVVVVLALALLAPVVLVVGVLLAQAVQHAGGYDPVRQTVSTLAGRGADERWVMTTTLFLLGLIYLAVAAGLRSVPRAGRAVLALGAVALVVVAAAPQPARGSSAVHMAAMAVSCAACGLWPLALVADPRSPGPLRRRSLAAVLAVALLVAWLCAQAWTDGTWLGVAERVVMLGETVWPIHVAYLAWRAAVAPSRRPARPERVTVALSCLGLPVFLAGLLAAQAAQPSLDPLSFSLSALASLAATDRWILTTTLIVVGALNVLVALGLRRVPAAGRVLLGSGGAFLVVTALFPQPVHGVDPVHMVVGGLAWFGFGSWPLALVASRTTTPRVRAASAAVVGLVAVLVGWFVWEMVTSGSWYGVSQRAAFVAMCVWPVVMAVHGARRSGATHDSPGADRPVV